MRAPRSCASPISASRISAVAWASGSARWQGATDVPKKYASEARLTRSMRRPQQVARERDGVEHGRGEALAR